MRTLAVLVFALLALAAPARADVQSAANALKSDPVYVDPAAELADQVDADALRARIKSAGAAPLFVAVLPASAQAGSAGRTLIALRQATGRKGTYALRSATSSARSAMASTPPRPGRARAAPTRTTSRRRSSSSSTPPARRRTMPARAGARQAR